MNLNNLTTKAQESVQFAQQWAFENEQQQIENEHLFQGILETDDNVIPFLFSKLNVNTALLKQLNESALKSFPKVNGGNQMLSQKASQTLMNAITLPKSKKTNTLLQSIYSLPCLNPKVRCQKSFRTKELQNQT